MRRSVFQVLVLLVLVVLLSGTVVIAADDELARKTLAGLPGVRVLVGEVKPPLETSTIQTDVELRLRRAGIRVLSKEEVERTFRTIGGPTLHVTVNCAGDNLVAYRSDVQLSQIVVLQRDPTAFTFSSTWSVGDIGFIGEGKLVDTVRARVRDLVDMFINAHLSVNPNVKPGPQRDDDEEIAQNAQERSDRKLSWASFGSGTRLGQALSINSRASLGRMEEALSIIEKAAQAWEDADKPQYAKELRELGKIMREYPRDARMAAHGYWANMMGPEKFAETLRGALAAEDLSRAAAAMYDKKTPVHAKSSQPDDNEDTPKPQKKLKKKKAPKPTVTEEQ